MFNLSFVQHFARISISSGVKYAPNHRLISTSSLLNISLTQPLCAEPLKKKKRIDPAVVKAREDRRKKKIEKQIRRLEKNARQLKPIDELEIPFGITDQLNKRKRPAPKLTQEVLDARAALQKEWSNHKREEYMSIVGQIDRIMAAQKRALDQLYEESEELYNEAVMPDPQLVPYSIKGPVATPPIKNYDSPDGEYIDVSKKWEN